MFASFPYRGLWLLCTIGAALVATAAVADNPFLPKQALTPGDALPVSAAEVCRPHYAKSLRHVDGHTKDKVYREYGIDRASGYYEIDHLISLSLGGSNDIRNLWPQSYSIEPWGAVAKDKLEVRLHELVCTGSLGLKDAQDALAKDWIVTYQKYIGDR